MSRFFPDILLRRVTDLSPEQLERWGAKVLVLDVDNTLTTHNNPVPDADVLRWLDEMKALGYRLVILSNNSPARVRPFARLLELDFTANAWKPLKKGFRETAVRLGAAPGDMVVVGDQIFTDVWGGNRFGARTVLVEPMEPEKSFGFRLKRVLEQGILRGFHSRRRAAAEAEE